MRLLKFGLGLLVLRRLPFRFVTRWLLRFAFWGGLAYALVRKFRPELVSAPPASVTSREPSAWTAPPPRVSEPDPAPEASESVGATSTIIEEIEIREQIVVETPSPVSRDVETAPVAEIAGDEMVDLIVSASMALEDVEEAAPPIQPRWIRADGSHDCPPDFPVKGKASSEIFHNPDSRHYAQTVPDVCFASDEDALAAGYRAPRR